MPGAAEVGKTLLGNPDNMPAREKAEKGDADPRSEVPQGTKNI